MSHPLIKLFHLSNFLHMPNNHRKVDVEFFCNLSCKRIIRESALIFASIGRYELPMTGHCTPHLQCSLNHHSPVQSLTVPGPNVLMMLQVISAASWPSFNSNKKIAQIFFLVSHHFHCPKYIKSSKQCH